MLCSGSTSARWFELQRAPTPGGPWVVLKGGECVHVHSCVCYKSMASCEERRCLCERLAGLMSPVRPLYVCVFAFSLLCVCVCVHAFQASTTRACRCVGRC